MRPVRVVTTAVALLLLLAVWAGITAFAGSFAFPGPLTVAAAARVIILEGGFPSAVATTLSRVVLSFVIGFAIAVTAGLLMGRSVTGERLLEPFIIIGLSTPAVAVTVLMLMILGMNTTAAVATIVFVITPLMVQTIWQGTKAVDAELLEMARVFDVPMTTQLREVFLPQITPHLFAAVRVGLGAAWKVVVIAEFFALGSGVGARINEAFELFSLADVMAWTITFVALMAVIEFLLLKPLERWVFRWRDSPQRQQGQPGI